MPDRWTTGNPKTSEYYYDEPLPEICRSLDKENPDDIDLFPLPGLDLSDAWVVEIRKSNLTGVERKSAYPAVFHKYQNPTYHHKGRHSKALKNAGKWVYLVAFGMHQFFGTEGVNGNLERDVFDITKTVITNKNQVIHPGEE